MDFALTPEQEQLRKDVKDFLEEEIRMGTFKTTEDAWMHGFNRGFSRRMAKRGWIGMTYPKEVGGHGRSYVDRLIVSEECIRYGAPVRAHWTGDRQVGPCILKFGTPEQQRKFLPAIIGGEETYALGFSEPDAGSDLASLKTQAIEQPDGTFLINGQKVWTSAATISDYLYVLARTDPKAPKKHQGLSQFLVSTKLPGVTIRPLVNLAGQEHYCEVFFDNVKVDKLYLIGQKGQGWRQVGESLVYERAGIERLMSNYPLFVWLKDYVKKTKLDGIPLSQKAWIRSKIADLEMKVEVGYNLIYKSAWMLDHVEETKYIPNSETAMAKFFGVDFEQELANVSTKMVGLYGMLDEGSKYVPIDGAIARSYLFSPGYSLQGGGSEVLRNIVAQVGLGLPRG